MCIYVCTYIYLANTIKENSYHSCPPHFISLTASNINIRVPISLYLSLLLSFSLSLSYVPSNKNGIFVPKRSVWLHSYLFVMCIFVLDHIERELLCISTIALGCVCFFGEKQTGKWLVRNFSNTLRQ